MSATADTGLGYFIINSQEKIKVKRNFEWIDFLDVSYRWAECVKIVVLGEADRSGSQYAKPYQFVSAQKIQFRIKLRKFYLNEF